MELAERFLAFFVVAASFYTLETVFKAIKSKPLIRRDTSVDLCYWFLLPVFLSPALKLIVYGVVSVLSYWFGLSLVDDQGAVVRGFGPVAGHPVWLMALEMCLVGDLIGYWVHRAFHSKRLFRVHAVHHSAKQLDWLTALRVHPLDQMTRIVLVMVALTLLGFPLAAYSVYFPLYTLHSFLRHANVDWTFGPLRYVFVSPRMHRWHHAADKNGFNANFASVFSFIDLIFGTLYLPREESPQEFGMGSEKLRTCFAYQMIYPLLKRPAA